MKPPSFIAGVLLFLSSGASAADLRVVNGVTVNLDQVNEWLASDRKAERPMKHWKQVRITEAKDLVGSWQRYAIKTESGQKTEIASAI